MEAPADTRQLRCLASAHLSVPTSNLGQNGTHTWGFWQVKHFVVVGSLENIQ